MKYDVINHFRRQPSESAIQSLTTTTARQPNLPLGPGPLPNDPFLRCRAHLRRLASLDLQLPRGDRISSEVEWNAAAPAQSTGRRRRRVGRIMDRWRDLGDSPKLSGGREGPDRSARPGIVIVGRRGERGFGELGRGPGEWLNGTACRATTWGGGHSQPTVLLARPPPP